MLLFRLFLSTSCLEFLNELHWWERYHQVYICKQVKHSLQQYFIGNILLHSLAFYGESLFFNGAGLHRSQRNKYASHLISFKASFFNFALKICLANTSTRCICDVLHYLVLFVQSKKPLKNHGGVLLLVKLQAKNLQLS